MLFVLIFDFSLRGHEREIVVLRSDNGETWREHNLDATEEAVQDVLNESFDTTGESFMHTKIYHLKEES